MDSGQQSNQKRPHKALYVKKPSNRSTVVLEDSSDDDLCFESSGSEFIYFHTYIRISTQLSHF